MQSIYSCNPNQITKGMFHRNFLAPDYTTKLHSSRQYLLAQKQTYRPMEQDREPRDKPTHH